jgi:subtilase family serine protease
MSLNPSLKFYNGNNFSQIFVDDPTPIYAFIFRNDIIGLHNNVYGVIGQYYISVETVNDNYESNDGEITFILPEGTFVCSLNKVNVKSILENKGFLLPNNDTKFKWDITDTTDNFIGYNGIVEYSMELNSNLQVFNVNFKLNKKVSQHSHVFNHKSTTPNFPNKSFDGSQLVQLYNVPYVKASPGIRQVTVAIIIAYNYANIQNDLNTYWQSTANFGNTIPVPKIKSYIMNPSANSGVSSSTVKGWNLEACLDIQMIATMNPYANIWFIQAASSSPSDLCSAITYACSSSVNADVISCSWGMEESGISSSGYSQISPYNSVFSNIDNKNRCFCVSTGDNNGVCWPSDQANVLAIGGTSLYWTPTVKSSFSRTEYTWENAACGYSKFTTLPAYQSAVNSATNSRNKYRAVPDISLVGNSSTGVNIVYANKWYTVGGTSVSAPLSAGILSIANQMRLNNSKSTLTTVYSAAPTTCVQTYLYNTIYPNNKNTNTFLDIITGTDGNYSATTGYDVATGLGSPNVATLCNQLLNL